MYLRYIWVLSIVLTSHISVCGKLSRGVEYTPATDEALPIVYHEKYTPNLGTGIMWAARWLHAFDVTKYQQSYEYLRDTFGIRENQFYRPEAPISDEELQRVHTPDHIYKNLSEN